MTHLRVPAVDISSWVGDGSPQDRAQVAAALDAACRTVGFVQVHGHGIPTATIDGLAAAMDEFFALPREVKDAYRTPPEVNRGYTPPKAESLSLSLGVEQAQRMNDFFEAFNVGVTAADHPSLDLPLPAYAPNVWPVELTGFEPRVRAYFDEAARVARTLTRIFARALDQADDFFTRVTDHSADVLRMNHYALPPGEAVELDGRLRGMGEHTDYGIVTVLWADQVPGLQVLGTDGAWHEVLPEDGALLVNLGDLTARWTNEAWQSTLHRVAPPVVEGTIRRRRSAAYFHDGNVEAVVEAIGTCVPLGERATYPPITVGEHIAAKLAGSRSGVANTAAARDAARVRAAGR
ncbi:MAG: 2-oxoglutarate and iron-dependent oxygenase domain-containing protein [Mycobacteriaceae bacterium]